MNPSLGAQPPPLPGESESPKRILPAFVLCFVLCAHRIYAGKIFSGILQIALGIGAFFWVKTACADLLAIASSGPFTMETIERISDWEQTHGVPFVPMLALIAVGIWVAVDAARLLAGKFTDRHGNRIVRWI
jgi:hypothetical protein